MIFFLLFRDLLPPLVRGTFVLLSSELACPLLAARNL
jgi:hypothetical protein